MAKKWKNFLRGAATILNIAPLPRSRHIDFNGFNFNSERGPTGIEADAEALRGDWERVGEDLDRVMAREAGLDAEGLRRWIANGCPPFGPEESWARH